jgi:Centromere DNA-binding protein complex CBF3 subunit, domain 2/Transcriptional activator of glycolytic enzymes
MSPTSPDASLARARLKITYKAATDAATATAAAATADADTAATASASTSTYNRDIHLTDKDNANAIKILEMTLKARAKNTAKNYDPKQREFSDWALSRGYSDRDTVTEAKLLSFLQDEVVNRPLRKRGKKSLAAADVDLEDQILSWQSVRSYVTAINDLYNAQKARNMNSNPSPRATATRDFIKTLQRRDTALAKQNYADKGRDTYLDGYTETQLKELCIALWKAASGASGMTTACYLRTLLDQLLGHYLLARGADRRAGEISDLHTFEFPDEGLTPCFPLIMTMRGSKTNQFGRLETIGAFRNKDPFICPLNALAFYLLFRWDLTEEPFPDFTERSRWYNTRLLLSSRGSSGGGRGGGSGHRGGGRGGSSAAGITEQLSYSTQLEWTSKAFKLIRLNSGKKTHLPRPTVVKLAELKGVIESQITRAGRWNHDQMTGCYLTCLPHDFMRRMGGHPARQGCFEIRRAAVTPPDELLAMIWPELDRWEGRFGSGDGQIDDLAASGFCMLLRHLREVILQDSVILMAAFPDHLIWTHRVFYCDAYAAFAAQLRAIKGFDDNAELSLSTRILEAMPELADNLQGINSQVMHQSRVQDSRLDTMTQAIAETRQEIAETRQDITKTRQEVIKTQQTLQHWSSGGLTFELKMTPTRPGQPVAAAVMPILPQAHALPQALPQVLPTPSTSPSSPPLDPQHPSLQPQEQPPLYRMRRDLGTVEQLYREWTQGLQGCLAIRELDRRYGNRWRRGRSDEIQFYSLRSQIFREIERIALANGVTELVAMRRLQGRQDSGHWSMDKLCKVLRAEAKKRGEERRHRHQTTSTMAVG